MTKRDIIILPDAQLRRVSEPIKTVDAGIRQLADDMLETMYEAPGIGLAAIQIAVPKRLLVLDVSKDDAPKEPMVVINPEIVWESEERSVYQEGCLSIPDFYEDVERPERVRVTFLDREGKPCELEADGILATCLQHEIDHLNGVLFIDHISKLKRDRVVTKFTKQARANARLDKQRKLA
ncbi:peptide deformylase [Breoghania sp. L-A4]|uniref:peptide deformylase n=1 Tax=Breoghania sp. L-A4 TaxID=2304600 RepID=UPI000E35BA51|nr:peptide deformylase [Breoghania sp. L-A4]AXS39096.1 peptide deformylase [Breoghania sp. L-A4]